MDNQIASRSQLSGGKPNINITQTKTPKIGNTGTKGVRNPRLASGFVLRITITPIQTRAKANKVPILTICPKSDTGTKPANKLTKTINIRLVFQGVRFFLCNSPNKRGNNP